MEEVYRLNLDNKIVQMEFEGPHLLLEFSSKDCRVS
jgi:hypothetical protein